MARLDRKRRLGVTVTVVLAAAVAVVVGFASLTGQDPWSSGTRGPRPPPRRRRAIAYVQPVSNSYDGHSGVRRLYHRRVVGNEQTIVEAAGGEQAFLALAQAWHARCLANPVVSHAFSHGFHPEHSERLAAYWIEALGGPVAFTGVIGDQTGVQRLHAGNGEHEEMDRRALACFVQALDDAGLPEEVRPTLTAYFDWAIGEMAAYPRSPDDVPEGLPMAYWSWEGPLRRPK